MQQIVTITDQGQLTIPKSILRDFGISGRIKAGIKKDGNKLIVEPKADFWSLAGSLGGDIRLTDLQLRKARGEFSKKWPQE